MLGIISLGAGISLSTGAAWKFTLDKIGSNKRITGKEFAIGAAALTVAICPLTGYIGEKVAIASNASFNEYWNGYQTAAEEHVTHCTKDGACAHTYACDRYTVSTWVSGTSKKPGHWDHTTKWHDCPVGTEEATYVIRSTVGDETVSADQFTKNTRPFRSYEHGLGGVPTTPPKAWKAAKAALDAGNPLPATAVHSYDNWILASTKTLLKKYSTSIAQYRKAGVLPTLVSGTHGPLHADKAYFAGWTPAAADKAAWENAVAHTGAALGTQKQGDLHVVLVNTSKVTDPDDYTNALIAYWQSPELGDNALSKNAVVLVLGTEDGSTVAWARAQTGMPVGNEGLSEAAPSALKGAAWDPQTLIGAPAAVVANGKVTAIKHTNGAFERILWDKENGFTRVCMTCKDSKGGVGYSYLKSDIEPTFGQEVAIESVMTLLAAMVWGVFVAIDIDNLRGGRRRQPTGIPGGRIYRRY